VTNLVCAVPDHEDIIAVQQIETADVLRPMQGGENMLGIVAAVLIVLWLLGVFAFHVTTAFFHIALVVGLVLLVLHFMRGRTAIV
jgi:Family of unknown function (DUF5670)